jgi:hypothetical protein
MYAGPDGATAGMGRAVGVRTGNGAATLVGGALVGGALVGAVVIGDATATGARV